MPNHPGDSAPLSENDLLERARRAEEEIAALTRAAAEHIVARVHAAHRPPAVETGRRVSTARSWRIAGAVAIIMVLLAMAGVAFIIENAAIAATYWTALVPLFGLMCVVIAWSRARREGARTSLVVHQVVHWLGIGLALALDFYVRAAREQSGTSTGLSALLLLGLGCFLAGVYLDWLLIVAGLLLFATFIVVAMFYQYVWLMLVIGPVALVVIVGAMWLTRKLTHRHRGAPVVAH